MAGDAKDRYGRFARRKAPAPERAPEAEEGSEQDLGSEYDFGAETSPDHIARMQSQLGNQAVLEVVEEGPVEEGPVEEAGEVETETKERRAASSTPAARTGLPPVHDGGGPDWDLLWGGDGEPDDDAPIPPPRAPPRRRAAPSPSGRDSRTAESEALCDEARQAPSRGAAVEATWRWIASAEGAADPAPAPESLVGLERLHPLERCRTSGRFLASAAADPVARALAALAGPLPGGPGLASLVARAAAVISAAAATEAGGGPPGALTADRAGVTRALSLALEDDARDRVEALAPRIARASRLAAQLVFDGCAEDEEPDQPSPIGRARPDLAEAALRGAARPWPIPDPPRYVGEAPPEEASDPALAALDTILRAATGGGGDAAVGAHSLAGMQQGAWALLEQAGAAQRELAAAAVAAWRVAGERSRGRLRAVLVAADRSLRALGRAIYAAGRRLGDLTGAPLSLALPALTAVGDSLAEGAEQLRRLRDAGFSALGRIASGAGELALSDRHAVPRPDRSALHPSQPRAADPAETALIEACHALRGGDLAAALPTLRGRLDAPGPLGMAAGVLLSGALLAAGRPEQSMPVALSVAERATAASEWPLLSAALLDVARCLELTEGVSSAREVLAGALARIDDPGVLLQARLLELGA